MSPLPSDEAMARAALQLYDLPPIRDIALANISENITFRVTLDDGRGFALRLHRPGYHSGPAIASELAWMMALARDGYALTPKPVVGRDGQLVQTVKLPAMAERHVVMSQWEVGVEPQISDDLQPAFEQLGRITAQMHRHAQNWQRPLDFTRFSWDFDSCLGEVAPHWGRWRDGLGLDEAGLKLMARSVELIKQRLEAYGKGPHRFGLIHGDTRLANLLIEGERIKILDFDDCGFGWFMYDAATTISFYEHEPHAPELITAWAQGYRQVAILDPADEREIPTFIMLRRLLLVAWVASHQEAPFPRSLGKSFTEQSLRLCEKFLTTTG